ncbi:NAD(P)H-dependent oxidoreductase [Streptomyces sp. CAU 1734]|uniref:NADPH-dependent FMN reductase n=1 Tax=Streptomyces sp. CAU 1734 TaxID=3140360 RepID=UPI00326174DF
MRHEEAGGEDVPPLRVAVVIGSTREGRVGEKVGGWFTGLAGERTDLELAVVDLIDFDLPARYPNRPTPRTEDFSRRIGRADAFVIITPEYNRSFPASLKQAIDCAYEEWQTKPVAFVSYGHGSSGLYAVEQLRSVFTELHTVTLRNGIGLNLLAEGREERGREGWDGRDEEAHRMLDQLRWWGLALREARAVRPYRS